MFNRFKRYQRKQTKYTYQYQTSKDLIKASLSKNQTLFPNKNNNSPNKQQPISNKTITPEPFNNLYLKRQQYIIYAYNNCQECIPNNISIKSMHLSKNNPKQQSKSYIQLKDNTVKRNVWLYKNVNRQLFSCQKCLQMNRKKCGECQIKNENVNQKKKQSFLSNAGGVKVNNYCKSQGRLSYTDSTKQVSKNKQKQNYYYKNVKSNPSQQIKTTQKLQKQASSSLIMKQNIQLNQQTKILRKKLQNSLPKKQYYKIPTNQNIGVYISTKFSSKAKNTKSTHYSLNSKRKQKNVSFEISKQKYQQILRNKISQTLNLIKNNKQNFFEKCNLQKNNIKLLSSKEITKDKNIKSRQNSKGLKKFSYFQERNSYKNKYQNNENKVKAQNNQREIKNQNQNVKVIKGHEKKNQGIEKIKQKQSKNSQKKQSKKQSSKKTMKTIKIIFSDEQDCQDTKQNNKLNMNSNSTKKISLQQKSKQEQDKLSFFATQLSAYQYQGGFIRNQIKKQDNQNLTKQQNNIDSIDNTDNITSFASRINIYENEQLFQGLSSKSNLTSCTSINSRNNIEDIQKLHQKQEQVKNVQNNNNRINNNRINVNLNTQQLHIAESINKNQTSILRKNQGKTQKKIKTHIRFKSIQKNQKTDQNNYQNKIQQKQKIITTNEVQKKEGQQQQQKQKQKSKINNINSFLIDDYYQKLIQDHKTQIQTNQKIYYSQKIKHFIDKDFKYQEIKFKHIQQQVLWKNIVSSKKQIQLQLFPKQLKIPQNFIASQFYSKKIDEKIQDNDSKSNIANKGNKLTTNKHMNKKHKKLNIIKVINCLLTVNPGLIQRLIQPPTNGMFIVWLFLNNSFQPVFVDGYLPYSKSNNPIYGWNYQFNTIGIFIKAIAKSFGGYQKLYDLSLQQSYRIITGRNFTTLPRPSQKQFDSWLAQSYKQQFNAFYTNILIKYRHKNQGNIIILNKRNEQIYFLKYFKDHSIKMLTCDQSLKKVELVWENFIKSKNVEVLLIPTEIDSYCTSLEYQSDEKGSIAVFKVKVKKDRTNMIVSTLWNGNREGEQNAQKKGQVLNSFSLNRRIIIYEIKRQKHTKHKQMILKKCYNLQHDNTNSKLSSSIFLHQFTIQDLKKGQYKIFIQCGNMKLKQFLQMNENNGNNSVKEQKQKTKNQQINNKSSSSSKQQNKYQNKNMFTIISNHKVIMKKLKNMTVNNKENQDK